MNRTAAELIYNASKEICQLEQNIFTWQLRDFMKAYLDIKASIAYDNLRGSQISNQVGEASNT